MFVKPQKDPQGGIWRMMKSSECVVCRYDESVCSVEDGSELDPIATVMNFK